MSEPIKELPITLLDRMIVYQRMYETTMMKIASLMGIPENRIGKPEARENIDDKRARMLQETIKNLEDNDRSQTNTTNTD